MKELFHIQASDIWLADYDRKIFCVGNDRFVDSSLRLFPEEDGFIRYKNMPMAKEEREAQWEKERWEHLDAVCAGLDSFSSTEVIEEIDDIFGTFGFKNKTGEVVIEPQYASVGEFSHGLCPVCLNRTWYRTPEGQRYYETHWGYIDTLGKTTIPFRFRTAGSFNKYGVAVVSDDYLEGGYLIDTTGKMIEGSCYPYLSDKYDYEDRFLEFSPVGSQYGDDAEDNIGLYDTKERQVMFPPTAESFTEFDEDTILVFETNGPGAEGQQRFINSRGENKYPWQVGKGFASVEKPNDSGYSVVSVFAGYREKSGSIGGKTYKTEKRHYQYGVQSDTGELVIPIEFDSVKDLGHNIFACYKGKEAIVFEAE